MQTDAAFVAQAVHVRAGEADVAHAVAREGRRGEGEREDESAIGDEGAAIAVEANAFDRTFDDDGRLDADFAFQCAEVHVVLRQPREAVVAAGEHGAQLVARAGASDVAQRLGEDGSGGDLRSLVFSDAL